MFPECVPCVAVRALIYALQKTLWYTSVRTTRLCVALSRYTACHILRCASGSWYHVPQNCVGPLSQLVSDDNIWLTLVEALGCVHQSVREQSLNRGIYSTCQRNKVKTVKLLCAFERRHTEAIFRIALSSIASLITLPVLACSD